MGMRPPCDRTWAYEIVQLLVGLLCGERFSGYYDSQLYGLVIK